MIVNGFDINPQNGSKGTHDISITPTIINEGVDREVIVEAICGDATDILTIIHEGRREVFRCADGDFVLADGGTFNVLKDM